MKELTQVKEIPLGKVTFELAVEGWVSPATVEQWEGEGVPRWKAHGIQKAWRWDGLIAVHWLEGTTGGEAGQSLGDRSHITLSSAAVLRSLDNLRNEGKPRKYWVGQKVHSGFPISCPRKNLNELFASPIFWADADKFSVGFEGSLLRSSVQSLSHVGLFATPWTAACQASLSITNSQSLPKPMSTDSVMPSNHLILCCPLLLLPSIFPNIRVFPNESALHIRWPKYWSFSFNISPSNEHPGLIFKMDWLDLLAVQGTLKSLLQHHNKLIHAVKGFGIVNKAEIDVFSGTLLVVWITTNSGKHLDGNTKPPDWPPEKCVCRSGSNS